MRLFLVVFCVVPFFCLSQINEATQFYAFNSDKGFPSNSIYSVKQDKLGYMWLGTENGLTKFDGYTFQTFYNKENDPYSLPHNRIYDIEIDANGTVWAGTSYGMVRYNRDKNNFTIYNSQHFAIPNNEIQDIEIDAEQNIWFSCITALCKLNQKTQKITVFPIALAGSKTISKIAYNYKNNALWVGSSNGLSIFNVTNNTYLKPDNFTLISNKELSEVITSIAFDKQNTAWVGTNYGRICKRARNQKVWDCIYNNTGNQITVIQNIFVDSKGVVYFLIDKNGLSYYSPVTNSVAQIQNKFFNLIDHRNMLCMFEDFQHNYWFGHQMYGLCYTQKNKNFTIINSESLIGKSFRSNLITAVYVDAQNTIWVGTDGGGAYYKTAQMPAYQKVAFLKADVIQSINADNKGNIWFGTLQDGVFKYSLANKSIENLKKNNANSNSLATQNVRKTIIDNSGIYWFATHGQGVTSFNPKTNTYTNYTSKQNVSGNWTYDIACDKQNNIWVATSYGLSCIYANRKKVDAFRHTANIKNTIVNDHLFSLHIDKNQNVWCATQKGISKYSQKTKQFTNFFSDSETSFNSIIEDDLGFLWFGTSNGIMQIDLSGNIIETFNSNDELGGSFYNINACNKDKKGNFYFGGSHGITVFSPKKLVKNTEAPRISVSNIFINETSMFDSTLLNKFKTISPNTYSIENLSYTDNNIQFDFTAINFINYKENKCAYRLLGLDTTWQYGKFPNSAKYNTLPPGNYVFEFKAANNSGIWNAQPIQVSFTIQKPFWETWIFRILMIVCILGLILLYVYYKTKAIQEQNLQLEKKVAQRTSELSVALQEIETEKSKVQMQNLELVTIADKLQEQNQELDKLNQTKNRLFSIIAHDIKNPFFLLLLFGKKLFKEFNVLSDAHKLEHITNINDSANTIYSHLSNMLDWARSQSNSVSINKINISLQTTLQEVMQLLQSVADSKHIQLQTAISEDVGICADTNMMLAIFRNLINNALKFTPEYGKVLVEVSCIQNTVHIIISDTGVGISAEDIENILNPNIVFTTYGTNNEKGTGLGISICQQFVKNNDGTLAIESKLGEGSRFILTFPKADLPLQIEPITIEQEVTEQEVAEQEETILPSMKAKVILIVEDNLQIQEHLQNELSKYFTTIIANNGAEAWKKIQEAQPDIVLTDVEMPEMNGHELCKLIKQTLQTSHIPVLMVTALKGDKDTVAGLESGANDYIHKPFKISELVYKIKNIFDTAEQIKKRFRIDQKDYTSFTSIDDIFMQKFTKLLEEKYTDPEANVIEIGSELGMSRTNLYRKCVALTGKNPTDLLQEIRIQNAIGLLQNTDLSISEIAYAVGYSDPRYFSTRFKSFTGKTPKEIRSQE